jgi:hypothetical protein
MKRIGTRVAPARGMFLGWLWISGCLTVGCAEPPGATGDSPQETQPAAGDSKRAPAAAGGAASGGSASGGSHDHAATASGGSSSATGGQPGTASGTKKSLGERILAAIQKLELRGDLPKLDRSDSVMGPDKDNNGVRDDIDAYVASLPDSPEEKAALLQMSASFSLMMVSAEDSEPDKEALRYASLASTRALHCLHETYVGSNVPTSKLNLMRKLMVNTRARMEAYARYNSSVSGWVFTMPREDTCDATD